jgi:hypothetical protein
MLLPNGNYGFGGQTGNCSPQSLLGHIKTRSTFGTMRKLIAALSNLCPAPTEEIWKLLQPTEDPAERRPRYGEWTPVPNDKINNVVAPDGGAHVCAPRQIGPNKGTVFCVGLPPEG